eukprot:CAMPEP_0170177548 /NCGR_PEP_ID=MMETSP0040_2-20121228/10508_1 /TAXON_ID=641309 /ORGANISM="Lotharella oceanica, Strain CCMP622" /LENGTH=80 /DNA_ID=CAMNT_0010420229 /DNA_START=37 /DNA_END=276 /DNA_ORIENTATION=+
MTTLKRKPEAEAGYPDTKKLRTTYGSDMTGYEQQVPQMQQMQQYQQYQQMQLPHAMEMFDQALAQHRMQKEAQKQQSQSM